MKEFVDKLISRLEEAKVSANRRNAFDSEVSYACAIDIVTKLAEEYKHCTLCYLQSPCEYQNENARLPLSELAEENGWIPCDEKLPIWFDNVLVCTKDGGRTIAHLTHYPIEWKDMHNYKIENVIAWCELPAPYTEGE